MGANDRINAMPASIPVFDIGGVLLDWNPRHLFRKIFEDEERMEWFLANVCTSTWNLTADAGRPFAEGAEELIAAHPDWETEIRAYDERWPEMIGGVLEDTLSLRERLRQRGPVYAITNYPREKWALSLELWPFLKAFDGVIVSGEVGLLKPDAAIFELLLERYGLAAEDCLFIDDVATNAEGARAAGLHGHHFEGAAGLEAELNRHGML